MASRDIKDCTPALKKKFALFQLAMDQADLPFMITCTARVYAEQVALFAQGREALQRTNYLRMLAKMPAITEKENARKVTWTLRSRHIINDGNPAHDKSRAFDIAITKNGKPCWDLKMDVNDDNIPDYEQAGLIGESVGLKWGGRFKSPDMPHFEDT